MRLLVTRPGEDGEATAAQLQTMGHVAEIEPLLTINFLTVPTRKAAGVQALIATSANGIRAFAATGIPEGFGAIPVLVIGEASAAAASNAGFENIIIGGGNLQALAQDVVTHFHPDW